MLRTPYNKLVRDEIEFFLTKKDIVAVVHQLPASGFDIELRKKIVEEVSELLEVKTKAGKLNALADIFELLSVFIQINGLSKQKAIRRNTLAEAYIFQSPQKNLARLAQELSESRARADILSKLVNLFNLLNGFMLVNEIFKDEVGEIQAHKKLERGGFSKGVYLEYTDE